MTWDLGLGTHVKRALQTKGEKVLFIHKLCVRTYVNKSAFVHVDLDNISI